MDNGYLSIGKNARIMVILVLERMMDNGYLSIGKNAWIMVILVNATKSKFHFCICFPFCHKETVKSLKVSRNEFYSIVLLILPVESTKLLTSGLL